MSNSNNLVHLLSGGIAGTLSAILTSPLEVVKTRKQSSGDLFCTNLPKESNTILSNQKRFFSDFLKFRAISPTDAGLKQPSMSLLQCLRHIIRSEGVGALFKGLGPNLIGVAPSRAIYFCVYSQVKESANQFFLPDTTVVHVISALSAGITSSTITNPVWFVKTRLQLKIDQNRRTTAIDCVKQIYKESGILGFYRGLSASYIGVSETVIHFVLYESFKKRLVKRHENDSVRGSREFFEFMIAGAISKTIASCIAYPHEVVRTRLREEGSKYRGFIQTLLLVWREDGIKGLYRGLSIQLFRQIPNTAIMMATYEYIVHYMTLSINKATKS